MADILIVDPDLSDQRLIAAVAQADGHHVHTMRSMTEALRALADIDPALIILDVNLPDGDGFDLCHAVRKIPHLALVPILVLTDVDELDERLRAFNAGADDFLGKPYQAKELTARMRALLRRVEVTRPSALPADVGGKVIGVFSLRGGVGVSTLATNLAVGMAQIWNLPTVLVDLSLSNGQSALMMDMSLRHTWSDLSAIPPDEITAEVVDRYLLKDDHNVRVLAAPRHPEEIEMIRPALVDAVLTVLTQQYHYVILDLPHDFGPVSLVGLDRADRLLMPVAPELASLRSASLALDVFEKLNYSPEKIDLIMNWLFREQGLPRKEIERVLKHPVRVVLPHSPEAMVAAITMGRPPVMHAPASAIGAIFEDLAFLWSKEEHKKKPPVLPGDGYARVKERIYRREQKRK